ncbi:ATP synthase mitochondrial F1 complex assembly factor 1 [Anopheles darlingi]|uniref:ATP synthase mitochondrial F1 complex assembly factor 1 n=1 Tax=Anopheles darlingi TaxID=43151 RepID=UPI0021002F66|nr:ATP synthase mitochondrial F1 complex assembly factor 1 [Anopheles darlingi]XP_049548519.1 ATP synthase mitochondrial F1 complex assembly factor 1 [Anopheles darlingi]XP_049548520.1 ATP synthase mitochondrial F1 complex assembly factor 1 [Anopheles darlingi]
MAAFCSVSRVVPRSFLRFPAVRGLRMSSAREQSEKVLEEMKEKNPYFDKYASKIAAVQQRAPEEFLSRLDKVEKEQKKPKFGASEADRDYSELLKPKAPLATEATRDGSQRKLSDIMRLELVEDKSADDIKHLWLEYHKNKEMITAVIPVDQHSLMMQRAKQHPIFILPIPRSQGYEFIMLQFAGNTIHFTPLLNYQVHKENAPECLNITFYTECTDKGVVLMRGEYDTKVINAQEAQCLANQVQLYYSQNNEKKLGLLETFSRQPEKFKHMDIIEELNNLQI